mgnify:FL=1
MMKIPKPDDATWITECISTQKAFDAQYGWNEGHADSELRLLLALVEDIKANGVTTDSDKPYMDIEKYANHLLDAARKAGETT